MEMKIFEARRPEILRKVKEGIARSEADKIKTRRERNAPPHLPEPDPPLKGEIERECRLESARVTRQLTALRDDKHRKAVRIVDCSLRDGIASLQGALSLEEKVWLTADQEPQCRCH